MSDRQSDDNARRARLRWITLGEAIAIAALLLSGLGLWHEWGKRDDGPTKVVEQRQPIPLTLRGKAEDDGRRLVISPVESGHALESLTLAIHGANPIELGSDGVLRASDVESAFGDRKEDKGAHRLPVRIDARYVEMGKDRRGGGNYVLRYRWEGGGLFSGRSLRLVSLGR